VGLLIGGLSEVFHLTLAFVYLTIMYDAGSAWNALKDLIAPFILTNMLGFGLLMYVFDKIRGYRDTETHAKQVEGELGVATSIQGSMLPKIFPEFPGRQEFSISASMVPAKEVGGDFYDFFFTDYDHFVFLVADVSGKGVPAALFMVIAKTLIKNNVQSGLPLADAMSKTNQQLLEGDDQQMFVTAWVGSLQISTGELTYVNCGHNPPLFSKVGQPFDYLKNISGFVLAGSRKSKYKPYTLLMSPGDRIFLYTDGITEAMNANLEQYGEKRLLALANSAPITNTPAIALDAVKADVTKFTAGRGPIRRHDDARASIRRLLPS
jgi:sigma-B regulation protein RsbU (phosphoserine phosphatase)